MKKAHSQPIYTPVLNIKPSYSTVYSERIDGDASRRTSTVKFQNNTANLAFNETGGQISKKAKKNIAAAIDWLIYAATPKKVIKSRDNSAFWFKINFLTLTLSAEQQHSDQIIKAKVLDPFLQELREKHGLKNYLWRAEAQANGNIHFHLITDIFIHLEQLRDLWNNMQNRLGYIDRFAEKHGHRNPNSTDVHSVKNISNVAAYLSKYCCKNLSYCKAPTSDYSIKKNFRKAGLDSKNVFKKEHTQRTWCIHDITEDQRDFLKAAGIEVNETRPIEGRLWFLSSSLQKMKAVKIYIEETNAIKEEFNQCYHATQPGQIKNEKFCTIIFWKIADYIQQKATHLLNLIDQFVDHLRIPDEKVYTV